MMTMHQCECHPAFAPEGGATDSTARLRQLPELNNEGHKQDLNIYDKQQWHPCLLWLYKNCLNQLLQGEGVALLTQKMYSADSLGNNYQKMQPMPKNVGEQGIYTQDRLTAC